MTGVGQRLPYREALAWVFMLVAEYGLAVVQAYMGHVQDNAEESVRRVIDAPGHEAGGHDGTSVVQTHMTNSRLTDPEVLDLRDPVRLESFEIRHGSGGAGKYRGGDGAVRRIRFLEPLTASVLSNGRVQGTFGLPGGQPGAVGENLVLRADGRVEQLGHIGSTGMQAGDAIEVRTPGGGGYGSA